MRSAWRMSSQLAIYAAIAANVAIAVTKLVVAGITGSSAMLSEGRRRPHRAKRVRGCERRLERAGAVAWRLPSGTQTLVHALWEAALRCV